MGIRLKGNIMTQQQKFFNTFKNIKPRTYNIMLQTDVFGNYFIIDLEDNKEEVIQDGLQPNIEYLKDEIQEIGYQDVFDIQVNGFKFKPNTKYRAKWYIQVDKDYIGDIIDVVPTIKEIKEITLKDYYEKR